MVSILKQVADHNIYVYIYGHIMPFWSLFLALCESKLRWEKKKKDMYKLMRVWKGIETRIDISKEIIICWEILHGRPILNLLRNITWQKFYGCLLFWCWKLRWTSAGECCILIFGLQVYVYWKRYCLLSKKKTLVAIILHYHNSSCFVFFFY